MKTTITCDLDGVMFQFVPAFLKSVKRIFPEKNIPAGYEPSNWNFTDIIAPEEFEPVWKDVLATRNFWENLKPYEENVAAMTRFIRERHKEFDIYFITSRPDTEGGSAFEQTSRSLIKHDLLWYNTSLIVVRKAEDKIPVLRAINASASLDDYLPTVQAAATIPGHRAYLQSRPWNQHNLTELSVKTVQDYLDSVSQPLIAYA